MSKQGPAGGLCLSPLLRSAGADPERILPGGIGKSISGASAAATLSCPGDRGTPVQAPSQQPVTIGSLDVEAFSQNLARIIEQGGRALAAYLKPREAGRSDREFADELTEVVKTLGQVVEFWLSDPQRTVELQTRLG